MPVAIHFLLNPLEGRVDEPPDYLKQNTQLLHFERLQNHEFDSQQMANFSRRLTNVENNLQRVTTDLQGLKDNVLVIMKVNIIMVRTRTSLYPVDVLRRQIHIRK
ncbi:unnamed protein product [Rotaria socialis]|uniref:Uncharacterized protein n=1 Tax=Rotaria socialis TaxID=392032 RepID=A0A821PYD2_9BILA|nr:unnamed protein product [Rotaria socialis]CAF4454968.1 unnamed protein product [Rotaria socialis]CAF4492309.1 unnamed protein product [Rotaria socialis]CAF4656840.1 unnamed protein product [Rotaria socialis]CAF4811144.1 unnamed protein product [Rotaria socialis]